MSILSVLYKTIFYLAKQLYYRLLSTDNANIAKSIIHIYFYVGKYIEKKI